MIETDYTEQQKRDFWNWTTATSHYFDLEGELKLTVLHPNILQLAGDLQRKKVLDFGCGEGSLSQQLAEGGATVVGVDKCEETIKRALARHGSHGSIKFHHVAVPEYSAVYEHAPYELIVVSFVTITMRETKEAQDAFHLFSKVIAKNGRIIFGESHPCFQNHTFSTFSMSLDLSEQYSGDAVPFEVEVRDGLASEEKVTFHDYHRSLSQIAALFRKSGFFIQRLDELYDIPPRHNAAKHTRENYNQGVPAYVLIEGVKK